MLFSWWFSLWEPLRIQVSWLLFFLCSSHPLPEGQFFALLGSGKLLVSGSHLSFETGVLFLGTHVVERKTQLLQVVLWSPHVRRGVCAQYGVESSCWVTFQPFSLIKHGFPQYSPGRRAAMGQNVTYSCTSDAQFLAEGGYFLKSWQFQLGVIYLRQNP